MTRSATPRWSACRLSGARSLKLALLRPRRQFGWARFSPPTCQVRVVKFSVNPISSSPFPPPDLNCEFWTPALAAGKTKEGIPDRTPERISEDMPYRMPDGMSGDMPDRIPEDMPD